MGRTEASVLWRGEFPAVAAFRPFLFKTDRQKKINVFTEIGDVRSLCTDENVIDVCDRIDPTGVSWRFSAAVLAAPGWFNNGAFIC